MVGMVTWGWLHGDGRDGYMGMVGMVAWGW